MDFITSSVRKSFSVKANNQCNDQTQFMISLRVMAQKKYSVLEVLKS